MHRINFQNHSQNIQINTHFGRDARKMAGCEVKDKDDFRAFPMFTL